MPATRRREGPQETVRQQMLRQMIESLARSSGLESPLQGAGDEASGEPLPGADVGDWQAWLTEQFPGYFTADFAAHHEAFWDHIWGIVPEVRPKPLICIWSRAGGKSSSVEPATIALGVKGHRKYAIYVSSTQDQADKHVESIGALLERSSVFAARYPTFANRLVGKYGHSKGWRRSRLTTQAGYTVDAAGLDKGVRGIKREGVRPDVIILDDLDDVLDSPITIARKIMILVRSILPAGSSDVAIIGVQNLIHPDSIFARLLDGRADFLMDRYMIGPVPAIEGLTYRLDEGKYQITGGRATWAGQSLEACQALMNDIGLTAFLNEAQHEVDTSEQGIYHHIEWQHCEWGEVPALVRVVVWVDPAVTASDRSDSHGVQADGLGVDGKIYRLFSWEQRTTPDTALKVAILKALELKADAVGVETDQGGETWRPTYDNACALLIEEDGLDPQTSMPTFKSARAGAGHGPKAHRQAQMLAAYERGSLVHVRGTHAVLERALKRFGVRKPWDLSDAAWWSWFDLSGGGVQTPELPILVTGPSLWGVSA